MAKPRSPLPEAFLPEVAAVPEEEAAVEVELPEPMKPAKGDVVELEDGSAEVTIEDDGPSIDEAEFHENLADLLPPEVIGALGREYVDLVDEDLEARKKRDEQYADGIERSGLTGTSGQKGGADFDGASKVAHPMLAKASIEFESRAIKELFPANGPAKTQIIGEQTEDKLDKAERKKTYMNWHAPPQTEETRSVSERLLTQVPMAGIACKRWWWDPELKRPRTAAAFADDVILPAAATDFYTSPRVTFRERIMRQEYERRIRTGLYRDLNLGEPGDIGFNEESAARAASDRVEGVDNSTSASNDDGVRVTYQIEVNLDIEEDPYSPGVAPYVMHVDKDSALVLGLYRNWKADDDKFRKKQHMTEWGFIPWREGPPIGFTHIIGSLSVAATGSLRALLDSAHINNFPAAVKLRGGKTSAQNIEVAATEMTEIDAPEGTMDPDIRKLIMQFPFNGPSPVLYNLLEWLTAQAEGTVATASEKIADGGADMPVGTAMALIEHGSANFRAIHARLHESMKRDLEIQHRLNEEFMEDEETVEELGELIVFRSDFEGPMDIVPVSDPNIFSEAQRYAQIQAILQLMADPRFMQFFKPDQILARLLRLMNVPDIEGITNLPKEAKKLGAVEENFAAAMNDRPLKVYAEQDDVMHLKVHVLFCTSPMFGANPVISNPGLLGAMIAHCKEHMMALYRKHTDAAIEAVKVGYAARGIQVSPENNDEIAVQGSALAQQRLAEELSQMVLPGLQQMQQALQQMTPPPQADPNTQLQEKTKLEIAKLQDQGKKDLEQIRMNLEGAIQKMADASTERLGKLASTIDLIKQQQEIGAKVMLEDMQSQNAQQLAVINAALSAFTSQMSAANAPPKAPPGAGGAPGEEGAEPVGGELPDERPANPAVTADSPLLAGIKVVLENAIAQMMQEQGAALNVDALQQNFAEMLARERETNAAAFAQLAAGVQEALAPRVSEIVVGPDGKKRGISYVQGKQPPPPPAPVGALSQSQPQGPQQ